MAKTLLYAGISLLLFTGTTWAEEYILSGHPDIHMELAEGSYDLWSENEKEIVDIQTGSYERNGKRILFHPEFSEVGDLTPSTAYIIDTCTIEWEGRGLFRALSCPTSSSAPSLSHPSHVKKPSERWKMARMKDLKLSIPETARVDRKRKTVTIRYRKGTAKIAPTGSIPKYVAQVEWACRPDRIFADREKKSFFFLCRDGSLRQLVFKETGRKLLVTDVEAPDFPTFKTLAIAASSLKPVDRSKTTATSSFTFHTWRPSDRSFVIEIPQGWQARGRTIEHGANGYIRFVEVTDPRNEVRFVGAYFPFYQFARFSYGYGANGVPPMEPNPYLRTRFFRDLTEQFGIVFEDPRFEKIEIDPELSERITRSHLDLYRQYGISADIRIEIVTATGRCFRDGNRRDLLVMGALFYSRSPLQNMGVMERWGPAPLYVATTPEGEMGKYLSAIQRMADSFQVDMRWLQRHMNIAAEEARQIIEHARKMSQIIHENSEARLRESFAMHEAEEKERQEKFWDTFFALGGEERYDDPLTGEEIDLPTGADRYFFDRYSRSWVGIHDDDPDAGEIIRHLRDAGFHELKLHTH
ncbi:hypothetical protein [Hydrogenimonas sp.]